MTLREAAAVAAGIAAVRLASLWNRRADAAAIRAARAQLYASLSGQFAKSGLKLPLADAPFYYDMSSGTPTPRKPESAAAVPRYFRMPLEPAAGDRLYAAGASVLGSLPDTLRQKVFVAPISSYHITLFHTSRPEPEHRFPPSADSVATELATARGVAAHLRPTAVEFAQLIMTPTGVLMALFDMPTGAAAAADIERFRRAFQAGFRAQPTPSRQTKNIIHVADQPLGDAVRAALLHECEAESARLGEEGLRLELGVIEFVEETTLGTSSGVLHPIPLA